MLSARFLFRPQSCGRDAACQLTPGRWQALIVLWEAGNRVCGKRLKALIPLLIEAMEQHGHLHPDSSAKALLLRVSAATIDRLLSPARASADGQRRRRTGVGSAIRRSI